MGCCHVKNQCLVIRLPKEIDHYQAEKVRMECEQSIMKFIIVILFLTFLILPLWTVQELAWYQDECGRYIQLMERYICLEEMN